MQKDQQQLGFRPFFAFLPNGDLSIVPAILATSALALAVLAVTLCDFLLLTLSSDIHTAVEVPEPGNPDPKVFIDRDYTNIKQWFYSINRRGQCDRGVFHAPLFEFAYNTGDFDPSDVGYLEQHNNPGHWYFDPDYSKQSYRRFRQAAIFGWMAVILGGLVWQFLLFGSCIAFRRSVLWTLSVVLMLTALMQGLTLIAFSADLCDKECLSDAFNLSSSDASFDDVDSISGEDESPDSTLPPKDSPEFQKLLLNDACNEGCSVGPGAGCAIVAMLLWFGAALVLLFLRRPEAEAVNEQEHQALLATIPGNDDKVAPGDEDDKEMEEVEPQSTKLLDEKGEATTEV